MDDLEFPRTLNEKYNENDSLPFTLEDSFSWESTKSWLVWLAWIEVYLTVVVISLFTLYVIYLRHANRSSVIYCRSQNKMDGKTVLITANASGIGLEAALNLAERGARVILACKEVQKAQETAAAVQTNSSSGGLIVVKKLDTSCMSSITNFANEFLKTEKRLDVLMLTANIGGSNTKTITEDKLETTMATNHFGHFLLVNLLLVLLKSSAPSRVVIVATSAHYLLSSINPKDLNFNSIDYGAFRAYAQSMACNMLMTNNLAHLTKETGVVVNSMCPGVTASLPFLRGGGIIARLYLTLLSVASRTDEEGAQTLIHLAVSEEAGRSTGSFFTDCTERGLTQLGDNFGLAKKIWERCEEIVGLVPKDLK